MIANNAKPYEHTGRIIFYLIYYIFLKIAAFTTYFLFGVKPIIHQSELRTYTKVVPFKENCSFRFVVL